MISLSKYYATVSLIAGLILLSGCSDSMEGTYTDETGIMTYEFHKDGTVDMNAMGVITEFQYELDGDRIRVQMDDSGPAQILEINDDGSISGPVGTLVKQ